jgi:hypothetical protein
MKTYLRTLPTSRRATLTALLLALAAPGCGDSGTTTPTTTSSGTGGSGGAGGSTTGTGGLGGSGGAGGTAGSGGTGGSADPCLPEALYEPFLTLQAGDLCAVAVYAMDGGLFDNQNGMEIEVQPTWGAHGGPLVIEDDPGGGKVTLMRYTPPAGASGDLTLEKTMVSANVPGGAFVVGKAVDLGFRPGTAISYSVGAPDGPGELIVVDGSDTSERYQTNGLSSMASHFNPEAAASSGRLLHTGRSPLGDNAAGLPGFYASDDCGGDFASCAGGILVADWGPLPESVVLDAQGNAFVVSTSPGDNSIVHAFASTAIAKGSPPAAVGVFLDLPGFGKSIAAIAPSAEVDGIFAFQTADPATTKPAEVIGKRYTAGNNDVTSKLPPSTLFTPTVPNTRVGMLTDPQDRLWVIVPAENGRPTTVVVIGRRPTSVPD